MTSTQPGLNPENKIISHFCHDADEILTQYVFSRPSPNEEVMRAYTADLEQGTLIAASVVFCNLEGNTEFWFELMARCNLEHPQVVVFTLDIVTDTPLTQPINTILVVEDMEFPQQWSPIQHAIWEVNLNKLLVRGHSDRITSNISVRFVL